MTIAVVDYGSGNLRSAAKAVEKAARDAGSAEAVLVTSDPDAVARADRIVLPGQGAFADCRRGLAAVAGLEQALADAVIAHGRPFLGICVGMQLMARRGHEHGIHEGLGWIAGEVTAITPSDPALKVPHMGWNDLTLTTPGHPVLAGIETGANVYFAHSYQMAGVPASELLATVEYGQPVTAIVGRDNLVGTQFHPEKSQAVGLRIIANFLGWRP